MAAGGRIVRARITEDAIDVDDVLRAVASPSHGAALLFLGVVRDHNEGRAVRGIRYEAYREMAEAELRRIAGETMGAAPALVALVHRVGELAVGDVSLAVAVSTPHRADSYALSRDILEAIKRRLPVWKRELYADGGESWVGGVEPDAAATGRRA
jgi:molybdopterin synthase catalytic subunit